MSLPQRESETTEALISALNDDINACHDLTDKAVLVEARNKLIESMFHKEKKEVKEFDWSSYKGLKY